MCRPERRPRESEPDRFCAAHTCTARHCLICLTHIVYNDKATHPQAANNIQDNLFDESVIRSSSFARVKNVEVIPRCAPPDPNLNRRPPRGHNSALNILNLLGPPRHHVMNWGSLSLAVVPTAQELQKEGALPPLLRGSRATCTKP